MRYIHAILFFSLTIFILLNTSSCGYKNSSGDISNVDIESNLKNLQKTYLSKYSDIIRYVPIENNSNQPLGWIIYYDLSEKFILISDGRICLLYDSDGKFIRPIGKQGRGPGEYSGINGVFIIEEKIFIHDFFTDDLIEYSLDGTLLNRYKSGFTADHKYRMEDAIMINDSLVFGYIENRTGKEEYKAFIIDKQGEIKYSYRNHVFFSLAPGNMNGKAHVRATIHKFDNNVYFKELYNDTLFRLDDHYRMIPQKIFNIGKYKEPFSERGMSWIQKDLSSYIYLSFVYQTRNFLILDCDFNNYYPAKRLSPEIIKTPSGKDYIQWYNYNGQSVLGVYDKRSGTLVFSEPTSTNNQLFTSGFYNDIDAGPRFFPDKMVNDSTMVMKIRFNHMTGHIGSSDFKDNISTYPERKKRLEEIVDSLKKADFDNPILMFVTFNK
jgi:hypothetical protein